MAHSKNEWDDLGRTIQEIVDQAINAQDYQKLNTTVRQSVERVVDLGGTAVRKAVDVTVKAGRQSGRPEPVAETKDLSVLYGSTGSLTTKGILKTVGGGVLTAVSGLTSLAALVLAFAGVSAAPSVLTLAALGGGAVLIGSGVKNLSQASRFKAYRKTMGKKTYCDLEKLARSVGKNVDFVRKEVLRMIDQGLFRQGHLDKEQTQLITSDETYRYYEHSRLQLEQRQAQLAREQAALAANAPDKRVQEVLDKGSAFLSELRRCNDAIPGAEISAKIDRMEQIVGKIFARARTNPEVIPDLKKMMDYYLPMTVKLLNAYADMDAQPHQGENIRNSKREIEQTLDTLNLAFEKLLDDLFADTALDVSSDISVLQTLLAQEGLTEDGLSRTKKNM